MRLTALPAALLLIGLAGCSDQGSPVDPDDHPPPGSVPVSYAADVQPIWSANCVGCHGAGGEGGLDLRASAGTAAIVSVTATSYTGLRVVPGDPHSSVLYLKLEGDPRTGNRMPFGGALSADELAIIHNWIAEGAANN